MGSEILPKVELHCHLAGILDPAMVWDICRSAPAFPVDPGEFEHAYPVESLESFIRWWHFIRPISGELKYLYPVIDRYIERSRSQGVRYLEVMIAASEIPQDRLKAVEEVRAFRDWVDQKESDDIQVEFLVTVSRSESPEEVEKLAERILMLYEAGLIVGVALAGPEQGNRVKPFQGTLQRFHEAGLGIEIHAGEWCGPESIWEALKYGHPDRIGHGVSLFRDSKLLDIVRECRVHVEMCPTSNLKTGSVSNIEEHPVGRAKELGLNFSINTDDPGTFKCSMESEYELLSTVFGFEDDDFQRIYVNSLEARFQSELRINDIVSHELGFEHQVHDQL